MIIYKKEFRKFGSDFFHLYNDGEMVIYGVNQKFPNGNTGFWVEIFKYKTHKPDTYHKDEYEMYPCSDYFGEWAWSCSSMKSLENICKEKFQRDIPREIFDFCSGIWAN